MRQIKFRGITPTGKWVYGTPVFYANGDICIYNQQCPRYGTECSHIAEMRNHILSGTLGQSTELTDKNGNYIYEGDIVNYDTEDGIVTAKVIWKEHDDESMNISGFVFEYIDSEDYIDDEAVELTVIGNIFENPELLK